MSQYSKYKDLGKSDEPLPPDPNLVNKICPSIENVSHKRELVTKNKLCVIDIYGDWCGPCKKVFPHFLNIAKKYHRPGSCVFAKENIDLQLTDNIEGVPTFLFYKNGKLVDKIIGANLNGEDGVESKVNTLLTG